MELINTRHVELVWDTTGFGFAVFWMHGWKQLCVGFLCFGLTINF